MRYPLIAFALLATTSSAPRSDAAAPTLACVPRDIVAGEDISWRITLTLANPLPVPVTLDSGEVVVLDRDPGETRIPRTTTLSLTRWMDAVPALAPGERRELPWTAPAIVESGRLEFRVAGHDARGHAVHLADTATVAPGEFSTMHPSELLEVDGHRVEVVYVAPPDSARPAPGVLLVHGHAHHARHMLRSARALRREGFAVVLLSQPGYGRSDGPADFMGPRTIAAASAALDRLARSPGVDSTRLGAWGVSRGATVVALLMEHRADVRAGVAQAGIYDPWAGYRGTEFDGIRANMLAEMGPDSAAWRARCAVCSPGRLAGRLLLLHGEDDPNVPFAQARGFYQLLKSRGANVEAEFFPAGHALPRDQATVRAIAFLRDALAVGAMRH